MYVAITLIVSLCTLYIGAVVNDFNCGRDCNGTYVGNLIHCLCNTSTAALTWNITISNCFVRCDFIADSDNCKNCTNCRYTNCSGDEFERFQVSYNNMTYTSTVSFSVNKTGDILIMCLNGQGPYNESCTVKVSGIVKLSVVYSLHIEKLT